MELWHVCHSSDLSNGERLHTSINGRFITLFRHKHKLAALDSVCYHASGPLTLGNVYDIEDLNVAVVSCPWHKFTVSIETGERIYQPIDMSSGRPVPAGWATGKVVQRAHHVREENNEIYVSLNESAEVYASDKDACNAACGQQFRMHTEAATRVQP